MVYLTLTIRAAAAEAHEALALEPFVGMARERRKVRSGNENA
jgi:hypothetical protein